MVAKMNDCGGTSELAAARRRADSSETHPPSGGQVAPAGERSCCQRARFAAKPPSGGLRAAGQLLVCALTLLELVRLSSAAMNLPDGIENILGFVPSSGFRCERDGYFGDIENDCKLFHLCQRQVGANGRTEWRHWTYACGNQTMFNQLTLTCAFVDEAIPCKHASQFQYLNEVIHKPAEPFLTDADVTSGISYYSNRIMSDGARARAFEDSQLLAQIGGNQLLSASASAAGAPKQTLASAAAGGQFNREPRQSFSLEASAAADPEASDNSVNSLGQPAPAWPGAQSSNNLGALFASSQQPTFSRQEQPAAPATGAGLVENFSLQLDHSAGGNSAQLAVSRPAIAARASLWSVAAPAAGLERPRVVVRTGNRLLRAQSSARLSASATTAAPVDADFGRPDFGGPAAFGGPHSSRFFSFPADPAAASSSGGNPPETSTTFATTSRVPVTESPQPLATLAAGNETTTPQAFSFSLATSHEVDSPASPTFVDTRPTVSLPSVSNFPESSHKFGPLQLTDSATLAQAQQQQLAEAQPVTASLFSSAAPPPPAPQQPVATTSTVATTTTTGASPFNGATPTLQTAFGTGEPATSEPPATTTTATTTTTLAAGLQLRRRQDQPTIRRVRIGGLANLERAHAGFQSTRLSASQRQLRSASATPIVMRREPTVAPASASNQSSVAGPAPRRQQAQLVATNQDWATGDFWRRPFADTTFTRRRV